MGEKSRKRRQRQQRRQQHQYNNKVRLYCARSLLSLFFMCQPPILRANPRDSGVTVESRLGKLAARQQMARQ